MIEKDRKKAINKKTVEKIGADVAEVIMPGSNEAGLLPDDYTTQLNGVVYEFLQYEVPGGADCIRDISQVQFKALCIYAGRKLNRSIICKDYENSMYNGGPFVPFSIDALNVLFSVWVYFAGVGGFIPFIDDFFTFAGCSVDYVYSRSFQSSQARVEFAQKIKAFQESGLAARLVEGRGNPTGLLAILNHAHGWRSDAAANDQKTIQAITADALPDLSGDIVQTAQ